MKVVYHVDDEVVTFNNGAIHVVIPPETPTEILSDYDANVLLSEKSFHGLVEVMQTKDKTGVHYDIEDAKERATAALVAADEQTIRNYVEGQYEDRVKTGRPVLPPGKNSRTERLALKYKIDFKKQFGLDIVSVGSAQSKMKDAATIAPRLAEVEADNAELRQKLKILTQKLEALLAMK